MTRQNSSGSVNQNGVPAAATDSSSSKSTAAAAARFFSNKANEVIPVVKSHCITEIRAIKFSYTWTIKNFSLCKEKTGQMLQSLEFSFGSKEEFRWRLHVYPRGKKEECKDYLSINLQLVSNQPRVPTKFDFFILNSENENAYTLVDDKPAIFDQKRSLGFEKFILLSILLNKEFEFLPDDNLTILCEGTAALDGDYISQFSIEPEVTNPKFTLSENFGSLFENQEFCDVTISVGGKDLLVHKAILAARSPVFAAMFKHEMEETKQNRVSIEDIGYDVLREMLVYIYTGKSPNVEKMARNLLIAADKYDLNGLREICEPVLCSTLEVTNAVDLLEVRVI